MNICVITHCVPHSRSFRCVCLCVCVCHTEISVAAAIKYQIQSTRIYTLFFPEQYNRTPHSKKHRIFPLHSVFYSISIRLVHRLMPLIQSTTSIKLLRSLWRGKKQKRVAFAKLVCENILKLAHLGNARQSWNQIKMLRNKWKKKKCFEIYIFFVMVHIKIEIFYIQISSYSVPFVHEIRPNTKKMQRNE